MQQGLDRLVHEDKYPAALAAAGAGRGQTATPPSPARAMSAYGKPTPRAASRRGPGHRWRTSRRWTPPGDGLPDRWGHGGDIPGYKTRPGVTDDGRAVTIAVTANQAPAKQGPADVKALLDATLCKK
ncbi:hypothetical protein ACH4SK_33660 [Streptomyces inhibens]|uniref:hypothetical protein n=1 Tax=Streptomyces inhibens TaxID=2293571 RepID=UPI00379B5EA8